MTLTRFAIMLTSMPLLVMSFACQPTPSQPQGKYESVAVDPARDTDQARQRNEAAAKLLEAGNYADARKELKLALEADSFFGPAHHNLGTVYFHDKDYYRAAWEYQMAAKLMPNSAQPRYNLGLVLERVNKMDDAIRAYEDARQLNRNEIAIAQALARVYVRSGRKDAAARELLEEIVFKSQDSAWSQWAGQQLAFWPQSQPTTSAPASDKP